MRYFTVVLMFINSTAYASQPISDYYDTNPHTVRRLGTVDLHHLGKAIDNYEAGHLHLAIKECEFILRYFPNHPRALRIMAETTLKLGTPERADPFFENATKLYPNTPSTYDIYGTFLYKQGKLDQAVESYKHALALNPSSAQTHYNLGLTYVRNGQLGPANAHAQAAYALNFPLPGLRNKLNKAGAWKPLPEENVKRLITGRSMTGH